MRIVLPRALLVVVLSAMIFTSTVSVLDALERAPSSFAAEHGYVITSPGAPTIFSSSVDQELAVAINSIQHASPEVFAFSSYDGVPFVVRGVELDLLFSTGPEFTKYQRALGEPSELRGNDAIIGEILMKRLAVTPPCNLTITASYASRFEVVRIVGWFESQSSLDDEVLVPLDIARALSGMSSDKVSIVRVAQISSDLQYLESTGPRFAIYDFTISKARVGIGESLNASVTVRNWGTETGEVNLTLADSYGNARSIISEDRVILGPGEELVITKSFSPSDAGSHYIMAIIPVEDFRGYPAQPLVLPLDVVSPGVRVAAPHEIAYGSFFKIVVTDSLDNPLVDAEVTFLNQTTNTGIDGTAELYAGATGVAMIDISYPGLHGAWYITVVDVSSYPNRFNPVMTLFEMTPNLFKESERATVQVIMQNMGSVGGDFSGNIILDNTSVIAHVDMPLGPGQATSASYPLGNLSVGDHWLTLWTGRADFTVLSWYADDSDLIALLFRYGGQTSISSATSISIVQAAKISQGDIQVALVSIGGIAGALAALSITSIFAKEIHEGRETLGILRTIGASRFAIRRLVLIQSLTISLPGAGAGVVFGLLLSSALLRSGGLIMFGHRLEYGVDASMAPVILFSIILICLASALASAEVAVRATPISSIRDTEEDLPARKTVDEQLGVD